MEIVAFIAGLVCGAIMIMELRTIFNTPVINYKRFVTGLVQLNHLINNAEDGYLWRELSGIETLLRESIYLPKGMIEDDIEEQTENENNV